MYGLLAWLEPWAASLRRERQIGDFRAWKEHNPYQAAFIRLLPDLKAGTVSAEEM